MLLDGCLFGEDDGSGGQELLVGNGLAEAGPVGGVVDAFAKESAFGKGEFVAFHPVLAAEAGGGVGHTVDKGEVEFFVLVGEGDGFLDFDQT